MLFLMALLALQDAAGPGPGGSAPPKPRPKAVERSGPGAKTADPAPAQPVRVAENYGDWRDTHRVTLRNGHAVDGVLDEKNSTEEGVMMKYSPTTDTFIRFVEIAKDADGKYMIHKITMRELGAVKPVEDIKTVPQGQDKPDKPDDTGKDDPKKPATIGREAKERAEAFLAALANEPKKQAWIDRFSKSGQDILLYAATQLPAMNASTASYCLAAFGKAKDARVLQEVRIQLAKVQDPQVLVAIVNMFGFIDDKKSMPAISKLIGHPDETVRYAVVDMAAKLGDRRDLEMVAVACADTNNQVRQRGSEVIVELATRVKGERDALTALKTVMRKSRPEGTAVIAHAMGGLGLKDAVQPLIELTMQPTVAVRLAAITSLGKLKASEGADRLHTMINTEKDKEVRAQAVESLIQINSQTSVVALINALKNEREASVQNTMARALRTLTGQNAGATYAEWKAWLDNRAKE